MDFIERIFGISPDNGSGTFEAGIIVLVIIVVGGLYFWRRQYRRPR
jgi:hypothetical protein